MDRNFPFEQCVEVLSRGLLTALTASAARIRELHAAEPIWAIAFDIIPGDPYIGVAFQLESEAHTSPLNSADWKHSHFIQEDASSELSEAMDYVHALYSTLDPDHCADITHLILLAAAHALLREDVAVTFHACGLDMPVVGDELPSSSFRFVVTDQDGGIRANYCEVVSANRATERLLARPHSA